MGAQEQAQATIDKLASPAVEEVVVEETVEPVEVTEEPESEDEAEAES
jgi:hypothetical protein